MADLPNDPDALARMLGSAGLRYDAPPPDPPPMLAADPPPAQQGAPPPTFQLPPDVAARAARQNAVADTSGPQTQAPPGAAAPPAQQVFAKPPPQTAAGAGVPQPRAGTPAVNPYVPYLKSLQDQQGAMDDVGRAGQQVEADAGVAAGLRGQQLDKDQADIAARSVARDAEAKDALAKYDVASKDAANAKIDPEHWKKSQGFFDHARYAIASFLGAFGAALTHTPDGVAKIIEQKQNADLEAQKQEIESKRGRVEDMKGNLAEMYRRFGNMQQSEAATRAINLEHLDAVAQQYGAGARSDLVRAKADLLHRQFQSEIEKQKAQLTAPRGAGVDPRAGILKRAQEIADKSGGTISVDDAMGRAADEWRSAYGGGASGNKTTYVAPGKEGAGAPPVEDAPAMSFGQAVASYIPGTDAYLKKQEQERHNVGVLGEIHKTTGLRGESLEHAADAYAVKPWTPKKSVEAKNEAARKYGEGGKGSEPPPDDFEEEDR